MRILFTTFSYFPETSGVPIVVQYLSEGLVSLGHLVTVVTRTNGKRLEHREIINGVRVIRFDCGQDLFKRNIGECDKFIEFVINEEKDILVLECLQCHTTDILLPHLHRINCKIVIHSHGAPGILMKPFGWEGDILHTIGHTHNWMRWKKYYRYIFPFYGNEFDAGICLSVCASDMDYLNKHIKKVYVAENAANDLFFDDNSYSLDITNILNIRNKKYILNISNFSDRKNQLMLMKSFSEIDNDDISLVLIGSHENDYYKRCVDYANKLRDQKNIDIVILHGIKRELFPSIIYHAELFTMTSKWEEYPVSLVESMAVGTPFLSTSVGNAHILPGGMTSRRANEFSSLLKTLLNNKPILERLGKQGKDYALHNNKLNVVVKNYESILNQVLRQ